MRCLAVDFGNTNTVVAQWRAGMDEPEVLRLPELSSADGALIPSCIQYLPDGTQRIGQQAETMDSSSPVFRWIKRYLLLNSPYHIRVGGKRVSCQQAAADFLHAVRAAAEAQTDEPFDLLTLTAPAESYEFYSDWLSGVFQAQPFKKIQLVDEIAAAAAGYGVKMRPGETVLVFDFGGSTMQAAVATMREEPREAVDRFRLLSKAGSNCGGAALDQWLFQAFLAANQVSDQQPAIRQASAAILSACEQLKIALSEQESAESSIPLSDGTRFDLEMDQQTFETLLKEQGLPQRIQALIQEALNQAADHGFEPNEIRTVLAVGGGSTIPLVRETIESILPGVPLYHGEPMTAVARGACAIGSGFGVADFIRHRYAIRSRSGATGDAEFLEMIPSGTPYPTIEPIISMNIKATYDGQRMLGLAIFELGDSHTEGTNRSELLFDEAGTVRILPVTAAEQEKQSRFWLNERNPAFLQADPPAAKGAARFRVDFSISSNKMLLLTAKDLLTGKKIYQDYPVVRLN